MFQFDTREKVLTISKVPICKGSNEYQNNEMYQSFLRYKNVGLIQDIQNILIPLLNEAIVGNTKTTELWIELLKVKYETSLVYRKHDYYSIICKFGGIKMTNLSKEFCIFKLPMIDPYGVLQKEGKQYAIISELVQDDDITYNHGELKIITKKGYYINLKQSMKKGPVITFRGKNISALSMMFLLSEKEGINGISLFEQIVNKNICNIYKSKEEIEQVVYENKTNTQIKNFCDLLEEDSYNMTEVREKVNRVLSLDRAIGETLAKSITLLNGEIIDKNIILSSKEINLIKFNKISTITVKEIPNISGYYTTEPLPLSIIKKGTEISEFLRNLIAGLEGSIIFKTLEFKGKDIPIIKTGTMVSKSLFQILMDNGYTKVFLKSSLSGKMKIKIPLERTIVGNRHFKENELGISNSNKYVYVTEEGKIEKSKIKLCAYDLAAMISLFDRLTKNKDLHSIADRDMGLRKKVNLVEESFHKSFERVAQGFVRSIKSKFVATYKNNMELFKNVCFLQWFFLMEF